MENRADAAVSRQVPAGPSPTVATDARTDCDELRELARELLDAEEAHRFAPTLENSSRLARVRRRLEAVLVVEGDGR